MSTSGEEGEHSAQLLQDPPAIPHCSLDCLHCLVEQHPQTALLHIALHHRLLFFLRSGKRNKCSLQCCQFLVLETAEKA